MTESVSEDAEHIITVTLNNLSADEEKEIEIVIAGDKHVYSVKEAKVVSAEMHAHNTFDAPELVKEEVFTAYKKCADGIKSCFRHAVWWNCACNNAKWTGSYGRIRTVLQKMRTGKTIRGRSGGISFAVPCTAYAGRTGRRCDVCKASGMLWEMHMVWGAYVPCLPDAMCSFVLR